MYGQIFIDVKTVDSFTVIYERFFLDYAPTNIKLTYKNHGNTFKIDSTSSRKRSFHMVKKEVKHSISLEIIQKLLDSSINNCNHDLVLFYKDDFDCFKKYLDNLDNEKVILIWDRDFLKYNTAQYRLVTEEQLKTIPSKQILSSLNEWNYYLPSFSIIITLLSGEELYVHQHNKLVYERNPWVVTFGKNNYYFDFKVIESFLKELNIRDYYIYTHDREEFLIRLANYVIDDM